MTGSQGISSNISRTQNTFQAPEITQKSQKNVIKDPKILRVSDAIFNKIETAKDLIKSLNGSNANKAESIANLKNFDSAVLSAKTPNERAQLILEALKKSTDRLNANSSLNEIKNSKQELASNLEKLEGLLQERSGGNEIKNLVKEFTRKGVQSPKEAAQELQNHLKKMHTEGQLFTHDSEGNEIPWSDEQLNEFLELATVYIIVQIKMDQIDELIAQLEEKEIHEDRQEGFHVVVNLRTYHHDRGKSDEKAYLDNVARLDQLRSLLKISQKAQKSLKDNRVEMFELDKEQTEKFLRILNESIKKEDLNKAILHADENLRVSKAEIVKHEDTTIVEITFKRRIVGTSDKVIKLYAVFNPKGLSKQAAA